MSDSDQREQDEWARGMREREERERERWGLVHFLLELVAWQSVSEGSAKAI